MRTRFKPGDLLVYEDRETHLAGPGFYERWPDTGHYVGFWRHDTYALVLEELAPWTFLVLCVFGPRAVSIRPLGTGVRKVA